jgi:DNA-binding beta-propeller fold protein YncE
MFHHPRKVIVVLLIALIALSTSIANGRTSFRRSRKSIQRLLYVTAPDGAMKASGKPGIYVYDIDNGHKLVKHISIPDLGGTRGCAGSTKVKRLYISHKNTSLMCFDLMTEKKVWEVSYPKEQGGFDRCCVTLDGKKVYVPEGWWSNVTKTLKVLDGETGDILKEIDLGVGTAHNTIMSPTGRRMYVGPIANGTIFVIDTRTDEIVKKFGNFGPNKPDGTPIMGRVSPYTINGAETLCFVNSHDVGFYVGDLKAQEVLYWVQVKEAKGFSHGIGMTPNEKEIWLADPRDKRLWVFDATVMPPRQLQSIDVAVTSHGWITFSLDGRYAWPDTGDVIDARTKKVVATLNGLEGDDVIRSSKFIEIHFRDGVPIRMGDQFGIGRAQRRKTGTR